MKPFKELTWIMENGLVVAWGGFKVLGKLIAKFIKLGVLSEKFADGAKLLMDDVEAELLGVLSMGDDI